MKYIKMKANGNYRGQEYSPDTILPVSESLFNNMILAGKGSTSTEDAYKDQEADDVTKPYREMSVIELSKVDYRELNKDPLIEFATACGLEVGSATKDGIYTLLEDIDFEPDE